MSSGASGPIARDPRSVCRRVGHTGLPLASRTSRHVCPTGSGLDACDTACLLGRAAPEARPPGRQGAGRVTARFVLR